MSAVINTVSANPAARAYNAALGPLLPRAELCRRAAMLHEAVLNQELTSMQIAARRLCSFARVHRLGPVAWHAAAIESICAESPTALARFTQLLDGLELAIEKTLAQEEV